MSNRNHKRPGNVSKTKRPLAAPRCGELNAQLERLKERLLAPWLSSAANPELEGAFRWAAHEAAALAWLTPCPVLVLPALLEEKARKAVQRWERQQHLWRRHDPSLTQTVAEAEAIVLPRLASPMMAA